MKFEQRFLDWLTKEQTKQFPDHNFERINALTARDIRTLQEFFEQPIDMLIFCPSCGKQHVDWPEPDICKCGHSMTRHSSQMACNVKGDDSATTEHYRGALLCKCLNFIVAWNNPPHKSHTCRLDYGGCGKIFRVADFPTNGVAEIKTRGKDDTWPEVQNAVS